MRTEKLFFDALTGQSVSDLRRGAGSAIFIEFGQLTPTTRLNGSPGQPNGELTLMIEWSWSSDADWLKHLRALIGSSVVTIELFGELPEILISLSCGKRVASFMISDGQPMWAIISRKPNLGSLSVENSKLIIESNKS